jgi:hypothetical protein
MREVKRQNLQRKGAKTRSPQRKTGTDKNLGVFFAPWRLCVENPTHF